MSTPGTGETVRDRNISFKGILGEMLPFFLLESKYSHANQLTISEPDWPGVPQGHGEFVYGPHRAGEMFSGQYDKGFRQTDPLSLVQICPDFALIG